MSQSHSDNEVVMEDGATSDSEKKVPDVPQELPKDGLKNLESVVKDVELDDFFSDDEDGHEDESAADPQVNTNAAPAGGIKGSAIFLNPPNTHFRN